VASKSDYLLLLLSSTADIGILAFHHLSKCQSTPINPIWDPRITLVFRHEVNDFCYLVFDIYHYHYDPGTGHLPEMNELEVWYVVFHQHGIEGGEASHRDKMRINRLVGLAHNAATLQGQPPFQPPRLLLGDRLTFRDHDIVFQQWRPSENLDLGVPDFVARFPTCGTSTPSGPASRLTRSERVLSLRNQILQARHLVDAEWRLDPLFQTPWAARISPVERVIELLRHTMDTEPTSVVGDVECLTSTEHFSGASIWLESPQDAAHRAIV
jgi:hypothetical protein